MNESPPAASLGGRFVRGALYLGTASWVSYAVNLGITLLVARLLGPESFGLYAFVAAVNEFINIIGGFGIAPALVQSREESDSRYDTAFAMSFGLGLIGLVIALCAVPILWANRGPEAAWFIALLGLVRLLKFLIDVPVAKLERGLRYGPIATIHLTTRNVPNFICLGLAWVGYGPWSLIVRDFFYALLPLVMSYFWSQYRFRRRVRREDFASIWSYSAPMLIARVIDTFLDRFDRLCVGWLFGNASIGLYHQARFIGEAGLLAARPITHVTFTLYSRLQDEPARLRRSYSIVNYFLARLMFGGVAVLLVYPEQTIRLLLGSEWLAAAPIIRSLGLYAGLLPLFENMRTLLFARARILVNIRLRLVQLAVFLPGVLGAAYVGSIEGVALSLFAGTTVGVLLAWYYNRDVIGGAGFRLYATPVLGLGLTLAFFASAEAGSWLRDWPFWVLPFLPASLFWLLVALLDRRSLVQEIRYLRHQVQREVPSAPVETPPSG